MDKKSSVIHTIQEDEEENNQDNKVSSQKLY